MRSIEYRYCLLTWHVPRLQFCCPLSLPPCNALCHCDRRRRGPFVPIRSSEVEIGHRHPANTTACRFLNTLCRDRSIQIRSCELFQPVFLHERPRHHRDVKFSSGVKFSSFSTRSASIYHFNSICSKMGRGQPRNTRSVQRQRFFFPGPDFPRLFALPAPPFLVPPSNESDAAADDLPPFGCAGSHKLSLKRRPSRTFPRSLNACAAEVMSYTHPPM